MKGDFTRITFDPANHFSRVLLQQGRVTLDADPNEQADILLHYLRTLARDLIGAYGGPFDNSGFALSVDDSVKPAKLNISAGRYYVNGILCENDGCDYSQQPDYTPPGPDANGQGGDALLAQLASPTAQTFWLYLDVWERHISWIENDHIREVALGGPDTCSRSKVVWQVKALSVAAIQTTLQSMIATLAQQIQASTDPTQTAALQARSDQLNSDLQLLTELPSQSPDVCAAPLDTLVGLGNSQLAARLDPGQQIPDPCTLSPGAAYRGTENQLYRVEIQQGNAGGATPTFKWSRDNGSVATRWLSTDGNDLVVTSTRGFTAGTWVELSDDHLDLLGEPGLLVKLASVQNDRLSVDPDSVPSGQSIAWTQQLSNPKVRRWDQTENDNITLINGAVPVVEATSTNPNWIDLEDGVQVQFAAGGQYRSGDYWLIPARVATATIDWPANKDGTLLKPPFGIEHVYAPLGFVGWSGTVGNNEGGGFQTSDCRCRLMPTNVCDRARYTNTLDRAQATSQPANNAVAAPAQPTGKVASPAATTTTTTQIKRVTTPKPKPTTPS
jgi:hypothetical protein